MKFMVVFLCFHVIKLRERQKNESYAERCVAGGFVGGFIQRRHGVADTLGAGGGFMFCRLLKDLSFGRGMTSNLYFPVIVRSSTIEI